MRGLEEEAMAGAGGRGREGAVLYACSCKEGPVCL